jgi:hypothetical protein
LKLRRGHRLKWVENRVQKGDILTPEIGRNQRAKKYLMRYSKFVTLD